MGADNSKHKQNLRSIKYGKLCTAVMTQFYKVLDDTNSRLRRLRWSPVQFTVLMAQLVIVMYAMTTLTNLDHEYRLPRRSRTIGNWMSEQHEVALQYAASNDIRLAVRLEHAERDVMTRVVQGTASSTDNSLLVALASRDQMLGNDGTSAWCPWWWSSSWYRLGNRVEEITPTAVLHALPTSCYTTADHDSAGQEVNQELLSEAEEFIAAQAEYVALPQLDGTDDRSPDDCHSDIPSHLPPPLHYHAGLPWLHGTLPWRSVKAVTACCAHVNPLRNFCDSAVFPQKPAATRIAVMNAVCAARSTLRTTRISQAMSQAADGQADLYLTQSYKKSEGIWWN